MWIGYTSRCKHFCFEFSHRITHTKLLNKYTCCNTCWRGPLKDGLMGEGGAGWALYVYIQRRGEAPRRRPEPLALFCLCVNRGEVGLPGGGLSPQHSSVCVQRRGETHRGRPDHPALFCVCIQDSWGSQEEDWAPSTLLSSQSPSYKFSWITTPADTTARNIVILHGYTARAWGSEGEPTSLDLSDCPYHCHTSLLGANLRNLEKMARQAASAEPTQHTPSLRENGCHRHHQTRLSESEGNFSIIRNTFDRQVGGWTGRQGWHRRSKDLLYSTGKSTQCSVVRLMGRKSKNEGYM